MKKIISFSLVIGSMPFLVFAADIPSVIGSVSHILNLLIPVLITFAVVYFIWGVIQYTISTDEEAKKGARGKIIQGLIGLFVIIAFWGIIRVFSNTFGIGSVQLQRGEIPCIPNDAQNNC